MQVIPFEIDHFDMMELDPEGFVSRDRRGLLEAYSKVGPSITLINDLMEPVASAGVVCVWDGLGEFWMVPGKKVPKYSLSVFKEAKRFIDYAMSRYQFNRVQATAREKDARAIRWIERLGFERECLMKCFGPDGENHYLYARVNDV